MKRGALTAVCKPRDEEEAGRFLPERTDPTAGPGAVRAAETGYGERSHPP